LETKKGNVGVKYIDTQHHPDETPEKNSIPICISWIGDPVVGRMVREGEGKVGLMSEGVLGGNGDRRLSQRGGLLA
jgi:hypothetical protein